MERLVTTSQASHILGLSLQGIHYRIKKNQLKSIKKSGKTFVYVSEEMEKKVSNTLNMKVERIKTNTLNEEENQAIIDVKNEQIILLKDSIKWMKKQYKSEILRLEKNQKKIINVFNSEIKLLQSAFNEMRIIYKNQPQLDSKTLSTKTNIEFIYIKDFFIIMKRFNKTEKEIKYIIFNAIQNKDDRFIYNKKEKKLLILKSNFEDLIN